MISGYKTIHQEGLDEFVISRSRFICRSMPVVDEESALSFIGKIEKAHWDAGHSVWAYILRGGRERCSDGGEPKGTAGFPALDVIRKEGVQDAVVVVTRYFGGIKLGAGGLIRAYARGAKTALDAGVIIERRPYMPFVAETDYACAEKLKREYTKRNIIIRNISYADSVAIHVLITPEMKALLYDLTAEIASGKYCLIEGQYEYLNFLDGEPLTGNTPSVNE